LPSTPPEYGPASLVPQVDAGTACFSENMMALDDRSMDSRFDRKREKEQRIKAGLPTEDEPALPPPVQPIHKEQEVGRNDPCPCGSGKKYKKCCGK
jgi:preprotein translocase subunit SecA